jgi:endonuclease IV
MIELGLKVGSIDTQYTQEILEYYDQRVFQYIELFVPVGSYKETIKYWKQFHIPFGIHAPHTMAGLNLANPSEHEENKVKIEETIKFADSLNANYIIFHSGTNGKAEEAVHQLSPYVDDRFLIENKPIKGFGGDYICVGTDYAELKSMIDTLHCGFCLDFGHAICAANTLRRNPIEFIAQLKGLDPKVYHLTDGDYKSEIDSHYHYGKGTFPLKELLAFVPDGGMITNEAKRENMTTLKEFYQDSIKLYEYKKS